MPPLLALEDVAKSFLRGEARLSALDGVSLAVEHGEVVAILGARGQGKSTLLRVAAGMLRPDRGRVLLDGENLWTLAPAPRQRLVRELVGWVEVSPPDLDVPVGELLTLPLLAGGRGGAARAHAASVLGRVGALDCAGRRWSALADRERALFALAQGLLHSPRLLLLDDLTATLTLGEVDEITGLVRALARELDVGVLMGVCDAGATRWSDRIATLAGGELLMPPDGPGDGGGELLEIRRARPA